MAALEFWMVASWYIWWEPKEEKRKTSVHRWALHMAKLLLTPGVGAGLLQDPWTSEAKPWEQHRRAEEFNSVNVQPFLICAEKSHSLNTSPAFSAVGRLRRGHKHSFLNHCVWRSGVKSRLQAEIRSFMKEFIQKLHNLSWIFTLCDKMYTKDQANVFFDMSLYQKASLIITKTD